MRAELGKHPTLFGFGFCLLRSKATRVNCGCVCSHSALKLLFLLRSVISLICGFLTFSTLVNNCESKSILTRAKQENILMKNLLHCTSTAFIVVGG